MDTAHAQQVSSFVSLDRPGGVVLSVEHFGKGNARPSLVFTHGFGQNRLAWRSSADQLAREGWHCMLLDARGHGDSSWSPDAQYELQDFVDDLSALVATRSDAVLVGASMGGLLALLVEAQQPQFAAIVLVDVTPTWESSGVNRIYEFMRAYPHGFDSTEQAAAVVSEYLPHREKKDAGRLAQHLRLNAAGRYQWHWDPKLLDHIPQAAQRYQPLLMDAAQRVHCPVHLVSGGKSDVVSAATIAAFQKLVPHATHQPIADATHMVVGDQNESFLNEIKRYLTSNFPKMQPNWSSNE